MFIGMASGIFLGSAVVARFGWRAGVPWPRSQALLVRLWLAKGANAQTSESASKGSAQ
jgi:hypothetical protein